MAHHEYKAPLGLHLLLTEQTHLRSVIENHDREITLRVSGHEAIF